MAPEYYTVLGVEESATHDEIKSAYRRIAKKNHPDVNPGNQIAAQKFKEAAEAYAVLGDDKKRKDYDQERAGKKAGALGGKIQNEKKKGHGSVTGFDFGSMSPSFEQFFGFRPGSNSVDEEKFRANKKTKTNPIDVTDLFERYMGIKK